VGGNDRFGQCRDSVADRRGLIGKRREAVSCVVVRAVGGRLDYRRSFYRSLNYRRQSRKGI